MVAFTLSSDCGDEIGQLFRIQSSDLDLQLLLPNSKLSTVDGKEEVMSYICP